MIQFPLILSLLFSPMLAISPDVNASKFEMREKKRVRVDAFDFLEAYPHLETIDIDGKKKKCVELNLTGEFPVLETINYEGLFGPITGKFTGKFPKLKEIAISSVSSTMNFDFSAPWTQSCTIYISNGKEEMRLKLPDDVGIMIYTKVGLKGRVFIEGYKKRERFGIFKKTYKNELADTSDIVLTLHLESVDGQIIIE